MTDDSNSDRVALVTGGGRGIGREICLGLARAGRKVAVADLRVPEATETATTINAEGGTAIAVEMDVADSDAVAQGLLAVVDELGPVEVLVNCAGWDELHPFVTTDEGFWDRVIEINYKGPLRTTHGCLPAMIEAGYGRDREHRLRRRPGRLLGRGGLCRRQGRCHCLHQDHRP